MTLASKSVRALEIASGTRGLPAGNLQRRFAPRRKALLTSPARALEAQEPLRPKRVTRQKSASLFDSSAASLGCALLNKVAPDVLRLGRKGGIAESSKLRTQMLSWACLTLDFGGAEASATRKFFQLYRRCANFAVIGILVVVY